MAWALLHCVALRTFQAFSAHNIQLVTAGTDVSALYQYPIPHRIHCLCHHVNSLKTQNVYESWIDGRTHVLQVEPRVWLASASGHSTALPNLRRSPLHYSFRPSGPAHDKHMLAHSPQQSNPHKPRSSGHM